MAEAGHDVEPRPGAVELVDALLAAGIPIAVASNSPRAFLDKVLATAGIADRFAITVAGDEVPNPKPAPDIYLEACRRLHADPTAAIGLEDSPTVVTASLADAVVLELVGLVPSRG
jgi:HAD superfamily hydrolase (TIGR01509 family)